STATYHGHVRDMSTRRMRVSIPLKNLDAKVFEGQSWIWDRFPSDITAEASHTALFDFLVAPMDDKKHAILGDAGGDVAAPLRKPGEYLSQLRALRGSALELNASQAEAVERAVHCETFHLIWGPPGT